MAEIIDSEKIRKKLIDFDGYMQQSIDILQTLKGIRIDTEKMFSVLQVKDKFISQIEVKLNKLQEDAENITERLSSFKESKGKEITDFINTHRQEAETLDAFINNRKQEIEDFLTETDRSQGVLIKTKLYEIKSEMAKFREQNSREITDFFNKYSNELDLKINKINGENENFKTQIQEAIDSARKDNDKQISDFLYKQTALVSNLNQQIDSYHKLTDTIKDNLGAQAKEVDNLKDKSVIYRDQIDSLTSQNIDLKKKMEEIMIELKKPLVKRIFGGK